MILQEETRKRSTSLTVKFTDVSGKTGKFAEGWFFFVHESFKPALDVAHVEMINPTKTEELRNRRCLDIFGLTHDALKAQLKANNQPLSKSPEHMQIMAYASKDLLETQGTPVLYAFRETDSMESRCGKWYVQVTQATPARLESPGEVGFQLFSRTTEGDAAQWKREAWYSTTQDEFVDLLQTGVCEKVRLTVSSAEDDATEKPVEALAL